MGRMRKMRGSIAVSIGVFFCLFSSALSEGSEMAGRIFYVTTTTSLSTVNTITFCHMLSATGTVLGTCSARKRKSFKFNDQPFATPSEEIAPSALDIEPSLREVDERQGRFVSYWITTTFTSTTTSYTATSTLASIICTPIGYSFNNRPGQPLA